MKTVGSNSAVDIRLRIEFLLKDRLKKLGSIRTDDAWKICRSEYQYGVIQFHFRNIMIGMKDTGKADMIRNGVWWIYKN